MPRKPQVIIELSGGLISGITADRPMHVMVMDYDNLDEASSSAEAEDALPYTYRLDGQSDRAFTQALNRSIATTEEVIQKLQARGR